jgi:excisionase family DNA binding protein
VSEPRYMTTAEVADLLRVSPDYVRAHAAELGGIRLGQRGGPLRFERDRVVAAMERRRLGVPRGRRRPGPKRKDTSGVQLLPVPGEERRAS